MPGPNAIYKLVKKWKAIFDQNNLALPDIFAQYDKNDKGKLNPEQFKKFCLAHNNELTAPAIEDMFLFFDRQSQDQYIDFEEFEETFRLVLQQKPDELTNKIINLKFKIFF